MSDAVQAPGITPFSGRALAFAEAYLESALFSKRKAAEYWGATDLLADEFLDLYGLSTEAVRMEIFPFLRPAYYAAQTDLDERVNPLAHFFHEGIDLCIDPHPLISFDWLRFSRPDLFEAEMTPKRFFSIFTNNLTSTSPFLDFNYYRKNANLDLVGTSALLDIIERGAGMDLPVSRWIDIPHYRSTYNDVPADGFEALLHLIEIGDAELRSPSTAFDPAWYQQNYSTEAYHITHPLHHFLRWGRLAKHAPREKKDAPFAVTAPTRGPAVRATAPRAVSADDVAETYHAMRARLDRTLRRSLAQMRATDASKDQGAAAEEPHVSIGEDALSALAFPGGVTPSLEVIVSVGKALAPAVATLQCLSEEALAGATGPLIDGGLHITLICTSADTQEIMQSAFQAHDNVTVSGRTQKSPVQTEAPYSLFLAAGMTFHAEDLNALEHALSARGADAATPLVLAQNGMIKAAGGMVLPDSRAFYVGVGMAPELCPWARDRDVAWAPVQALLLTRDTVASLDGLAWRQFAKGQSPEFGLGLKDKNKTMHLAAKAHFTAQGPAHVLPDVALRPAAGFSGRRDKASQVRIIAHLLPHFAGQTASADADWTTVAAAQPSFYGHVQPRVPTSLGFYDQRVETTLGDQIRLARRYGVDGFLLRYYNMTGKADRDTVLQHVLAGAMGGLHHALCWDPNGAGSWIEPGHIVPDPSYAPEVLDAVIADAIAVARQPGAIAICGKPLFAVMHTHLLPDPADFARRAREAFDEAGFPGVHLAQVEPAYDPDRETLEPKRIGFDSLIQDPPHSLDTPPARRSVKTFEALNLRTQEYRDVARAAVAPMAAPVLRFPTVCPGYDDTSQSKEAHLALADCSPPAFQAWLRGALNHLDLGTYGDERLIFINAWNDWANCAYLEPDLQHGHHYLQAVRDARLRPSVLAPVTSNLRTHGSGGAMGGDLALFVHAYYVDVFEEIIERYHSEHMRYPIYVTTQDGKQDDVAEILSRNAVPHRIFVEDNHGRDVLPFIRNAHHIQRDGFRYVLKLHTKKSPHREDGAVWRNELFAEFLNRANLERIKTMFDRNPDLGIAGPEMHILPLTDHLEENYPNLERLAGRLEIDLQDALTRDSFVAGTMFFARFSSLVPILRLGLQPDEFESEAGQLDGTLAHGLERAFGVAARLNGRRVATFETIMGTRANMPSRRSFHT